jgi:hypothetical protein
MSKRFFIIFLSLPLYVNAQVVSDAKLWTGISISKKINDFELSLSKELRFDENINHIDKSFLEIGAKYKLRKGLYAGLNYRFNRDNDYSTENYDLIHRIDLGFSYKKKINKFRFGFRTKIQLKGASQNENNPFVSRNKFSVKYKLNKKIAPYVAYEFYYQFNNENVINRTRIALGSSYKISDKSAIKLFYMFENRFNVKNLKHNHVYGLSYSIEL